MNDYSLDQCREINSLPPEVLKNVLDFLPIKDKRQARLACQIWRFILDEFGWPLSVCFSPKLKGSNENVDIRRFLQSYRTMDVVEVHECNLKMSKVPHKQRRFPDIEGGIILGKNNSQATVVNFLKLGCTQAKGLFMEEGSMEKTRRYVVSGLLRQNLVGFAHLTDLIIEVNMRYCLNQKKHAQACSTFLKHARIPSLRGFGFILCPWFISKLLYTRTMHNYFLFIKRHASQLTGLACTICHRPEWNIKFDSSVIPQTLKLQDCIIHTTGMQQEEKLLIPALTSGSCLKTISVKCLASVSNYPTTEDFTLDNAQKILEACSNTLEEIEMIVDNSPGYFDVNCLRPIRRLKELRLSINCATGHAVQLAANVPFYFPLLTKVKLYLKCENGNPLLYGFETLLTSCGTSIKKLKIGFFGSTNPTFIEINGWKWLNACVNLKFLKIKSVPLNLPTNTDTTVFLRMQEFDAGSDFDWVPPHVFSTGWIARRMPNLKVLKTKSKLSLPALMILLTLTKLQEIYFTASADSNLPEILNYCESKDAKNYIKLIHLPSDGEEKLYKISRMR